jgi:hypothetical protein
MHTVAIASGHRWVHHTQCNTDTHVQSISCNRALFQQHAYGVAVVATLLPPAVLLLCLLLLLLLLLRVIHLGHEAPFEACSSTTRPGTTAAAAAAASWIVALQPAALVFWNPAAMFMHCM